MFIVDYACAFRAHVCEIDYTCKLRSEAALRALKKYPEAKIVLGAGMDEVTGGCGSLAGMMETFFLERGVPRSSILVNPIGHNTLTETEAAYSLIQKEGGGAIVCTTSKYHSLRVRCIWFFRFGIIPKMFTTPLTTTTKGVVREMLKVPFDCVRAFLYRFF